MQKITLGPGDLKKIQAAQSTLAELQLEMNRAEQAGLDVSQIRKEAADLQAALIRFRSTYFPSR